jgi:hypothetical protein
MAEAADVSGPVPTGGSALGNPPPEPARAERGIWVWYVVAFVTYVVASMWQKALLNWIVGPLWLVGVVLAGPALIDRLRRLR